MYLHETLSGMNIYRDNSRMAFIEFEDVEELLFLLRSKDEAEIVLSVLLCGKRILAISKLIASLLSHAHTLNHIPSMESTIPSELLPLKHLLLRMAHELQNERVPLLLAQLNQQLEKLQQLRASIQLSIAQHLSVIRELEEVRIHSVLQ